MIINMMPNFIGIGAPKSGTTWIFKCLKEHPDIFAAEIKETNFFDHDDIDKKINDYLKHFKNSNNAKATGEISTRYLTSYRSPERIKKNLPNVRLFVSLRNPIDQVYSHYWHLLRQNFHQWDRSKVPRSFEEALNLYEDRLIESALYYKHLSRWLHYFDKSQLFIILYDDIRDNPIYVLKTLYSYLGVNDDFLPTSINEEGSSVRRGTSPRNPFLGEVYSFLHDQLNRNVYHNLKQLIGTRAAIQIKDKLRVREVMEYLFQQKGYPEMNIETRAYLYNYFASDIEKLSKLTNRDLSHWK